MQSRRRNEIIAWSVAVLLTLAGLVWFAVGLLTPVSFGWFAYQPLANATFSPGGDVLVVSRATAWALVPMAIGLTTITFLAGWRLGRRPAR